LFPYFNITSGNSQGYKNVTFHPFSDVISDELSFTYKHFEDIMNRCMYHKPSELENILQEISMLHINARSIVNKFDEFKLFLSMSKHKWCFICVSETWLTEDIETLFCIENYKLFCKSRTTKSGGGSAIYVLEDMPVKMLDLFQFSTADAVFLSVNINRQQSCLILQIYRAPRNNSEFLDELEKCLNEIVKLNMLAYIMTFSHCQIALHVTHSFLSCVHMVFCQPYLKLLECQQDLIL
jgi:hypothetical protein